MLFLCIAEWLAASLASTQYKLAASSTFDKQKCPQTWPNVSCGQNHPTLITTVLLEIFRLTSLRRKHKWSLYLEGSFSFYWNILYMKDYAFTWPISSWAFHKGKRKANILTILKIVIYSIKNSEGYICVYSVTRKFMDRFCDSNFSLNSNLLLELGLYIASHTYPHVSGG